MSGMNVEELFQSRRLRSRLLPLALILAEELAEAIRPVRRDAETIVNIRSNVNVSKPLNILSFKQPGHLRELSLWSANSNFNIYVSSNTTNISMSYSELAELSPYSSNISAFSEDGLYVVYVKDIKFRFLEVVVSPASGSLVLKKYMFVVDLFRSE